MVKITYTYGADGKMGYAYSEPVTVAVLGGIDRVVKSGTISKNYSGDEHIFNATTEDYRSHYGIDVRPTTSDKGMYAVFTGRVKETSAGTVWLVSMDGSIEICYQSLGLLFGLFPHRA